MKWVFIFDDVQRCPFRMRSISRRHKPMVVFTHEAPRDDAVKKSCIVALTKAPFWHLFYYL